MRTNIECKASTCKYINTVHRIQHIIQDCIYQLMHNNKENIHIASPRISCDIPNILILGSMFCEDRASECDESAALLKGYDHDRSQQISHLGFTSYECS